jgi:hypothetical protein
MAAAKKNTKVEKKVVAKEEPGARAARLGQKIKVLDKAAVAAKVEKRPDSAASKTRSLYKSGMTVGEFVEAGGDTGYLLGDTKRGIISVG